MNKIHKFDTNRRIQTNKMAEQAQVSELIRQQHMQIQTLTEQIRSLQIQQQQGRTPAANYEIGRTVQYMSTFTGKGDISINSFISNVEYQLSTLENEESKKIMTRAIYYEKIQGEAKNCIINIPDPSDWDSIKIMLKMRYKPDAEPSEIYKRISNIRANSVSELAIIIQDIKYKSDEVQVYYNDQNFIDLSNVNSLLVNTVKEMTQGILLDKIYNERDLGNIVTIMRQRRYEDSCIREEYRNNRNFNNFNYKGKNSNSNNKNGNVNNRYPNDNSGQNRHRYQQNYKKDNNYSNSYQFNNNNNVRKENSDNFNRGNSGSFRRNYVGSGQSRNQNNSGQYRQQQSYNRQDQGEPMDIANIQSNPNNSYQMSGNPNNNPGQDRHKQDYSRQRQEEFRQTEHSNNVEFFMN